MKSCVGILCSLVLAVASFAGSTEFSGYYKNFFVLTDAGDVYRIMGLSDEELLIDDYQRFRFRLKQSSGDWLKIEADYEIRAVWGDTVPLIRAMGTISTQNVAAAGFFVAPAERRRFLDMESDLVSERDFSVAHGIDRLQVRLLSKRAELSVGRQSVSWGSGFFWTPTDVFSAFSPTEIDKDEKTGVDVVRLLLMPTPGTGVDLVFEPLSHGSHGAVRIDESAAAARITGHAGEYDIAGCAGYIAGDWMAGADFAGYIGDAGFHGEARYTLGTDGARDYLQLTFGMDYSFQARFAPYGAIEYYYNGAGTDDPARYVEVMGSASVQTAFERGTSFNVGRNYVGGILSLTLTPLVGLQSRTIVNLDDRSAYEYTSVSWSTSANTELILGAALGMGAASSELGSSDPDLYFAYFKLYY